MITYFETLIFQMSLALRQMYRQSLSLILPRLTAHKFRESAVIAPTNCSNLVNAMCLSTSSTRSAAPAGKKAGGAGKGGAKAKKILDVETVSRFRPNSVSFNNNRASYISPLTCQSCKVVCLAMECAKSLFCNVRIIFYSSFWFDYKNVCPKVVI